MVGSRTCCAVAAAIVFFAVPATAAPNAAEKETARSLLRDGDQRAREKDDVRALAAYRAADEIMNVPTTGIEVARTLERLGQLLDARDRYLAVKALPRIPGEPAVMDKARQAADDAQRALLVRIPSIQIHVSAVDDPAAVRLRVDDLALPILATLLPRKVNPGKHVLLVSAPGYNDERLEVSVVEGDEKHVEVRLERGARRLAPPLSPVAVAAAPPAPAELRPPPRAEPARPRSPLAYVALAAGGVGVGAATGLFAFSRASAARTHCTGDVCTPAAQSDIDASKTFGVVSTVAFGVGLAGLGVGTYLFVSSRSRPRAGAAAAWNVALGPGSVAVGGTFQ